MEDLWNPIDPDQWQATPHIRGRAATESDVAAGRAVFFVDDNAVPADFYLPACGYQLLEDGTEEPVVIVQAEIVPGGTLLGVRYLEGGNGICFADEVRVLVGGFGQSLAS
jgi:hypothetical protein